ncbi:MAG: hypothetical protein JWL59_1261 [Chthoniobacteraceae bacterium]|nr:hypothetical protein [Chthoniobacteraceae bacterium]
MSRLFLIPPLLTLTAGCATQPLILNASHPASPSAPEAPMARSTLRADANTVHTHALLAERERQAKAAESEAAQTNFQTPEPMKERHEQH